MLTVVIDSLTENWKMIIIFYTLEFSLIGSLLGKLNQITSSKARGRIFHYLGSGGYGGASGSLAMVSEAERTARQKARYNRRNVGHQYAFAKTDVTSGWVPNDTDLAAAWALDRTVTTAETSARGHHRVDSELAKNGEEWSLSDCSANAGRGKAAGTVPPVPSAVAKATLRTAQQEAEWLLGEHKARQHRRRRWHVCRWWCGRTWRPSLRGVHLI